MGDKIALSKRIGSDSKYGIAYLAEGMGHNTGSVIKVAVKVLADDSGNRKEVGILKLVSEKVRAGFPNFPLAYTVLKCDRAICQLGSDCHSLFKNKHMVVLNELAHGDLSMWMRTLHTPRQCYSAIAQIFVGLMAFHELGFRHADMHWGNALYHDIPAGGCWHYRIGGEDVYIENTGQLWVLWDFGMAEKLVKTDSQSWSDYSRIMHAFMGPPYAGAWLKDPSLVPPSVASFANAAIDKIRANFLQVDKAVFRTIIGMPALQQKTGHVINAKPYIVGVR
jgi:hypothetical protein